MKQCCEIGSRLGNWFISCKTWVTFFVLFLVMLLWSLTNAAATDPDLRLDNLFPPGHQFSNPFQPRLFPRHDEGLAPVKSPCSMALSPDPPQLNIRLPISANVQTAYVHSFQPNRHDGRFALGGLGLVPMRQRLTLLGEVHVELESLQFAEPDWRHSRLDWSGGLGVRGLPHKDVMLGANFFADGSHLGGQWHKSGGIGLETAVRITDAAAEAFDMTVNLHRGGGIDVVAGLSFPVHDYVDLRVSLGKHRFYDGDYLLGWKAAAELSACRDLFCLTYEFEQDRDRSACHTIGAALSANLNLEDLFSGSWPFERPKKLAQPEKRFASRMSNRVKRSWHQPDSFVTFASNSKSVWNAPGDIRFEVNQDFSPTLSVLKAFLSPSRGEDRLGNKDRSRDASVQDRTLESVVGVVGTAVTGVLEYGYRFVFGPFKTDPRPERQRVRSAEPNRSTK